MSVGLFLGALPYAATSQIVCDFLWDWVVPENVQIVLDRDSGRSKGFGFAQVSSPEDAVAACRAQAATLMGRAITVNVERRRSSRVFPERDHVTRYLSTAQDAPLIVLSVQDLQDELVTVLREDPSARDIWVTNSLIRLNAGDRQIAHESVRMKSQKLVELLAADPRLLVQIDPQLFEFLIAALLTATGYREVRLTAPSADGGVDIWATRNSGLGKALYIIQCKRYAPSRKITRPDVQLTYGVLASSAATGAAIVTTSTLTKPAQEFMAENQHRISAYDGRDLEIWLQATSQLISPIGRSFPPRDFGQQTLLNKTSVRSISRG